MRIRQPIIRAYLGDDDVIVDNFAGGGGVSEAFKRALGRSPDHAINHDPEALTMHAANHPETKHHCGNIWDYKPRELVGKARVAAAWFSPDCFPAGTLVLTRRGYEPIESLAVGDEVLTHRGRWRSITETSSTRRPLMRVRGHGHPGLLVSPEHPFYARPSKHATPDWIVASNLDESCYWSTPVEFPPSDVPEVPRYRDRGMTITAELMWLAGRYVADGWTRLTDTRAELVIACGRDEAQTLTAKLAAWPRSAARAGHDELAWHGREIPSTETSGSYQLTTSHRGLVEWLREHFGHGAEHKAFPSWTLGMDRDLRVALLDGYVSGDGCVRQHRGELVQTSTISKALAFSTKALAASIGHSVVVYLNDNSSIIEGRHVNAKPIYTIRWRPNRVDSHRQTVRDGHLEFAPIREVEHDVSSLTDAEDVEVFNIGVDEDESYVVEGIVVHNCKDHSSAKGGKPVNKRIRSLAWTAVRWAAAVKPGIIFLENVPEFAEWGPCILVKGEWKRDPARKGQTFRKFIRRLQTFYKYVEWRLLRADDYGAPTKRKRFFLMASDRPLVWPTPTHGTLIKTDAPCSCAACLGSERSHAPRTAAECIDFTNLGASIFMTRAEARAYKDATGIRIKRPLEEPSLQRIAAGIDRYVLKEARPFLIPVSYSPKSDGERRVHSVDDPMPTITSHGRGRHALVSPVLYQSGYGERPGQRPRYLDIREPLGTVVGCGQRHAMASALLAPFVANNTSVRETGGWNIGAPVNEPMATVTAQRQKAMVAAHLIKLAGTSPSHLRSCASSMRDPVPTITASGWKVAQVAAFLVRYNGKSIGQDLRDPCSTLDTTDRLGLVTVVVDGETYVIADILMRMLEPRELFRASDFPEDYIIDPIHEGKPLTRTSQVRMCGNAVPPAPAAALIAAQFPRAA